MIKRDFVGRLVAAALLGSALGWYIHNDEVRWGLRGQTAFVAYQAHRFEMYMVNPRPLGYSVFVSVLLVVGLCGLYEFISYWVQAATNRLASEKRTD